MAQSLPWSSQGVWMYFLLFLFSSGMWQRSEGTLSRLERSRNWNLLLSCFLYSLVLEKQSQREAGWQQDKRTSQRTREIVQNNFIVSDALPGQIITSSRENQKLMTEYFYSSFAAYFSLKQNKKKILFICSLALCIGVRLVIVLYYMVYSTFILVISWF